jgi:hexosaminidase
MPLPSHVEADSGRLAITNDFVSAICGAKDARLEHALTRALSRLGAETALTMPRRAAAGCANATLQVTAKRPGALMPRLGEDESYELTITSQGAKLAAETTTGAMRGLETFLQLVDLNPSGFGVRALTIRDNPRFPWRGLMLDVSRHWMPIEVVKRNLDAMAAVKLNVFHWHLADDQGFRAESRLFPKLTGEGSDGNFYTQAQLREIIEYAAARGIRVIPEFDIPGHTTSWLVGYPELASAPGPYTIERSWGIFKPTLDPTRESTYRFLDRFIGEMAAIFPDEYFHIGGDEVDDTQWKNNAAIQRFMQAHHLTTSAELHAHFNRRLQAIVARHGKKMIGWDEVLHPDLPTSVVIQSWRGQQSLAEAARKGYRGLLSFGYYLDHMRTSAFHYANDPLSGDAGGLNADETARILGGEACMWTEYVSTETVDSRIWPRLAVIAERLWSPREVTDVDSMYARMDRVSRKLDWTGIDHRRNQERMLSRIAGDEPAQSIQTIANAVEALGIGTRHSARKYTSLVPLNRLGDAARPESEQVRRLSADAQAVVDGSDHDGSAAARLRAAFSDWRNAGPGSAAIAAKNPLAEEAAGVGRIVSQLGDLGLQALDLRANHQPIPPSWIADRKAILDPARVPVSEVNIATIRVIDSLLATPSPSTVSGQ